MAGYIVRGPENNQLYNESFGKLLFSYLKNGGSNIAMVNASTNESTTYEQILQRTVSLAYHLRRFGITKGDTISIISENSLYFTIPAISALYLGIIVVPMNHFYTPREFLNDLIISKPKIIFCSFFVLNNILMVTKEVGFVEKIIVIDNIGYKDPFHLVLNMKKLLKLPITKDFKITAVSLDDVAAIIYSSGTTGTAKGVMLTHKNFNAAHAFFKHKQYADLNSTKIGMALPPFHHAYGFVSHLCMLIENMKMIVFPKFEEHLFLFAIQQYKISVLFLVPPLVVFLNNSPLVENYDLSSIKDIMCGAAPMRKEIQERTIKRLNLNIRQGYGLTETTFATYLVPPNVYKLGTVGILVEGLECKVIDIKTNEVLGPNKPGELCFRGVQIMKGYYGNPEATAVILDRDGWLHSGDVGYYDKDEYFYIVDRYKELIKYKGHQVAPSEIEEILLNHPQIKDCAVIGRLDEKAGELPIAFVVKQPNSSINESEVIKFVTENVSYHKRLHGGVKFMDIIPRNPTGKILRRILREQLKVTPNKL